MTDQDPESQPTDNTFMTPPTGKKVLVGPESVEPGKVLAMVSYAGIFISIPLGVIPMFMRDNEFAMYHGKQATASFIIAFALGIILSVVIAVTCGFGVILLPIMFLPLATAIHGLIIASKGEMKEPFGVFGLGNKLFGSLNPGP